MKRFLLGTAIAAVAALGPAGAQDHCSHETVTVRGVPLSVGFCIAGAPVTAHSVATVALEATYASKSSSFVQRSSVRFITGEGPARALESIDLRPLGINGTLHMTLLYSGNEVTMEHALLTPGAITVK